MPHQLDVFRQGAIESMSAMKRFLLNFLSSNDELRGFHERKVSPRPRNLRRQNVGIAVIDDEPFAPQTNLNSYGFNVVPIGDLRAVDGIAPYDIVLCDLMGVGQHFDGKLQGASIIREIKRVYPEKYVIAYTGAAMNAGIARQATEAADDIVRKDVDIDDWVQTLDHYTDLAQDPYEIWLRIREGLTDRGADTKDIILLEDAFVRSVMNGDARFSDLGKVSTGTALKEDVKSIVHGLISSAAIAFVFG